MSYEKLVSLGRQHGTDKATSHNYLQIYAKIFERYNAQKEIKFLEIGAGDIGASHKMWRDYFPEAQIFCFDPFHLPGQKETLQEELIQHGVKVFQGNQLVREDLKKFLDIYGGDFDVIIDDAAHMPDAIQISLGCLFPFLKNGGLYIVEDLITATSRQSRIEQVNNNIKNVLDTMHVEDYILWEALQELEKNKTWPSNTLSSEEKEYLVNNVQNYKFFDDIMGRNNLCVIRKK